jgi:hypothetical protein
MRAANNEKKELNAKTLNDHELVEEKIKDVEDEEKEAFQAKQRHKKNKDKNDDGPIDGGLSEKPLN